MNKPKRDQHFVPKVYLKGFSEDDVFVIMNEVDQKIILSKSVPIDTICFKKDLYETKNNQGEFVNRNYLEECLRHLEIQFTYYRERLKKRAYIKDNYKTNCFFTKDEKTFWRVFITLQMLRSPKVLETAKNFSENYFGESMSKNDAHAMAVKTCLPFFEEAKPDSQNCFMILIEPLYSMSIALGVDYSDQLITSDNPVYCYSPNQTIESYSRVVFPLTSDLVIVLSGQDYKNEYGKNRLFEISDIDRGLFIKSIAYCANRFIYSKKELSKEIENLILEARRDRTEDNKHIGGAQDETILQNG